MENIEERCCHDYIQAIERECPDCIHNLRDIGRDINEKINMDLEGDNFTPLHYACGFGAWNREVVIALLERGADPNIEDFERSTPLHVSTIKGHSDLCGLLLEKGADMNRKDDYGKTSYEIACERGINEIFDKYIAETEFTKGVMEENV